MALTRRALVPHAMGTMLLAGATPRKGWAQPAWPQRTVTLLIPYSPGTGNDLVGRVVANKLSELLPQRVVGDNRSGASGNIAVEAVRRASPDGHTLVVASVSFSMNPHTMRGVGYTPADFTPVAMIGALPFTLMVGKGVPANSMTELVALLKARPDELHAAQGGSTGTTNFLLDAFKRAAGVEVTGIPYKGTSEGVLDLLAGRIQLMFAPISTALPPFRSGEVKVLGITGSTRAALLPEVPTFRELGLPTLDISTWFALVGPAGVPEQAVRVMSEATRRALAAPEVVAALNNQGITPGYAPPEALAAFLRDDYARWHELVRQSGFTPQ